MNWYSHIGNKSSFCYYVTHWFSVAKGSWQILW